VSDREYEAMGAIKEEEYDEDAVGKRNDMRSWF